MRIPDLVRQCWNARSSAAVSTDWEQGGSTRLGALGPIGWPPIWTPGVDAGTPSIFPRRGAKGIPTRVGKLWKGLVPPVALGEEAYAGAVLRSRFWGELGRWNVRGQRATVPNSPRFVSTPQGVCQCRNLDWR